MEELETLLVGLPGYSNLSAGQKQAALNGSLIPDADGHWPAHQDYTPTYDVYFAAYSLVGFLRAFPFVTSASSEGTSVAVQAPDWDRLLSYYRGQSIIMSGSDVIQVVNLPGDSHVYPTDMSGRYSSYGDTDTDLG